MKMEDILAHNMRTKLRYIVYELMPHMLHNVTAPGNRIILLFTLEGVLFTLVNNLIGNNNNLFAIRLGAGDYELSLVIMLPQLVGMLVLIPGGILTDRLKNKRSMVTTALTVLAVVYVLIGFVPMLRSYQLGAFLTLIALSLGPMTLYNVSWQAYFSDVVHIDSRNNILAMRTGISFLIGVSIMLLSGSLLASVDSVVEKLRFHQIFYWFAGFLLLIQIFILRKIKSETVANHSGISVQTLKAAFHELFHNRKFLGFVGVAIFFYMTWHMDWTLYFLGQQQYLQMNESWLSSINIGGTITQFLTIGLWSRINVRKGVRFSIIFGALGLALFPITMIIATSLPVGTGRIVFFFLNTLSNFAMATTSLNVIQCLLQVLPEKNKTLNISIYTMFITLSNAIMPFIGVRFYRIMGADLQAFHRVFLILFFLRIVAAGLWALRWWMLRNEPK